MQGCLGRANPKGMHIPALAYALLQQQPLLAILHVPEDAEGSSLQVNQGSSTISLPALSLHGNVPAVFYTFLHGMERPGRGIFMCTWDVPLVTVRVYGTCRNPESGRLATLLLRLGIILHVEIAMAPSSFMLSPS